MKDGPINRAAMIITRFTDQSQAEEPFFSLDLHDCMNSTVIDLGQRMIFIREGPGWCRFEDLVLGFDEVWCFESMPVSIGHSCVDAPVKLAEGVNREAIKPDHVFVPHSILLVVKSRGNRPPITLCLGTTPTPIILPQLQILEAERQAPTSIEAIIKLSIASVDWVRAVNLAMRKDRSK